MILQSSPVKPAALIYQKQMISGITAINNFRDPRTTVLLLDNDCRIAVKHISDNATKAKQLMIYSGNSKKIENYSHI